MGTGSLPRGKAAEAWHWPSSAEVEERVDLYLYSPSGPSWLVLGWIFPLLCVPNAICSTDASFKPKVKDNFCSLPLVILFCTKNFGTKCCRYFVCRPIVCHLIRQTKPHLSNFIVRHVVMSDGSKLKSFGFVVASNDKKCITCCVKINQTVRKLHKDSVVVSWIYFTSS